MASFSFSGSSKDGYSQVSAQDNQQQGLSESLVATPQAVPVATSIPMMQVVAPATLPEGYVFDAVMGDGTEGGQQRTIKVTVPPGGVEEGQQFSVPMPAGQNAAFQGVSIPVGHWRDDVFDCFHYGPCHTHVWTSLMCTLLAAGQVISRLKFTWYGSPAQSAAGSTGAFQKIFAITVCYFLVHFTLFMIIASNDPNLAPRTEMEKIMHPEPYPLPDWLIPFLTLYDLWKWTLFLTTAFILANLRQHVRVKYGITAPDHEDLLCSFCCSCCVAAQMLRHTTDYDQVPSRLCSPTGLPAHAAEIV